MGLVIGKENFFDNRTLIYELGDDVESIAYIIEGSIEIDIETDEFIIEAGNFIALKDLCDGFYVGNYTANAGCKVMAFPADSVYSLVEFLTNNPDIHKMYYMEFCSFMHFLYKQYEILYNEITNIYDSLETTYDRYINCCNKSNEPFNFLMPHEASLYEFKTQAFSSNYNVFLNGYKLPERLEAIYEKNPTGFLKQQLNLINSIYTIYDDMIFFLKTEISLFASNSQDCLFFIVSKLVENVSENHSNEVLELLTDMKQIISSLDKEIKENTGITLDIDYNRVNFYFMMASNVSFSKDDDKESEELTPTSNLSSEPEFIDFADSLHNICSYANFDIEKEKSLDTLILQYIHMNDKEARDDEARLFRKNLTNLFFELYENVFIRYAKENTSNKIIELFLDYGFLDERLLTDNQLEYLTTIKNINKCAPCNVYRMKDWLLAIYHGKKMPSKNEFDKDYIDHLRELKRTEHLSPTDENRLLNDSEAKAKYEINNMLKYNCRILSGSMLTFVPILSMYNFDSEIERYILTSEMINDAINECLDIDYSAFYREQMYTKPENKIEKEVIQLEVFPDIILFPVYGINGVMWQDISGKRSNTKGRFFLPSFFRGNINDSMIMLIGRFRWELCKTIMGTSWNNVIVPSLTAEYSDYVQFYRKNRDLTAEKKEALKNQITRCRNNNREVFITDYFIWIKYEAAGAIRLNKVSRKILATYCPFSKELRQKLNGQPMFDEAMKRFNLNNQKKASEMITRIRALERFGADITEEIYDTQKFYNK